MKVLRLSEVILVRAALDQARGASPAAGMSHQSLNGLAGLHNFGQDGKPSAASVLLLVGACKPADESSRGCFAISHDICIRVSIIKRDIFGRAKDLS